MLFKVNGDRYGYEQKKYAAVYNGLLTNQGVYERSLNGLQLICDSLLDTLKSSVNLELLGDQIELIDIRNTELEITRLLGINVTKNFMPSVAIRSMLGVIISSAPKQPTSP